jgi:ATP-dependent DNA ligase
MAAALTRERFESPEWVFERKLDGIRLLAFKRGPTVEGFSRNHFDGEAAAPDASPGSKRASEPARAAEASG